MRNITVEYDERRCIGAAKCVEIFPQYFSLDGEKAVLQGAKSEPGSEDGLHVLSAACSAEQVHSFIKAAEACPVNAIKVIDRDLNQVLVDTEVRLDSVEVIYARYDDLKEFVMDPYGYFLIRIDPIQKTIEVGLCRELNKVGVKVIGEMPLEIYQTIIKRGLVSRMDHAAYLGRELQKAYIALQKGIPYVQDDELNL